jgi:hypothetical protein
LNILLFSLSEKRFMVKLLRKTQQAAKSFGESQAGFDPEISEWGNLSLLMWRHLLVTNQQKLTRGSETSQYP